MDENTLNDLLECSVCLERLDTTSKVLPCQHTFCRKCLEVSLPTNHLTNNYPSTFHLHKYCASFFTLVLFLAMSHAPWTVVVVGKFLHHVATCIDMFGFQIIVASHNELRCPECRVLIEIKIDDLPPNVLLMRILGGKTRYLIYIYLLAINLIVNIFIGMKTAQQNQSNVTNNSSPSFVADDHIAISSLSPKTGSTAPPNKTIHHTSPPQRSRPTSTDQPTTPQSHSHQAQHINITRPQQPQPFSSKHIPNSISIPHARALFDYAAKENG